MMLPMPNWRKSCQPTRYPGIFKTQSGCRIRVRTADPRTGTMKGVNKEFRNITLNEALAKHEELRQNLESGVEQRERPRVGDSRSTGSSARRQPSIGTQSSTT